MGDNEDVSEDESSFDAETTGDESSFDNENYDVKSNDEVIHYGQPEIY